jgi:hypothetical protein
MVHPSGFVPSPTVMHATRAGAVRTRVGVASVRPRTRLVVKTEGMKEEDS